MKKLKMVLTILTDFGVILCYIFCVSKELGFQNNQGRTREGFIKESVKYFGDMRKRVRICGRLADGP